jgi:hypothetical protein
MKVNSPSITGTFQVSRIVKILKEVKPWLSKRWCLRWS